MAQNKNEKVGIVGSGLIGKSWAMIFASEGFSVVLYDVDQAQVNKAIKVEMILMMILMRVVVTMS